MGTRSDESSDPTGTAIRDLLNEWDFIGVVGSAADGGPLDEYDCLIEPVLERLAHDRADLGSFLRHELDQHFGLDPRQHAEGIDRFVAKVVRSCGCAVVERPPAPARRHGSGSAHRFPTERSERRPSTALVRRSWVIRRPACAPEARSATERVTRVPDSQGELRPDDLHAEVDHRRWLQVSDVTEVERIVVLAVGHVPQH